MTAAHFPQTPDELHALLSERIVFDIGQIPPPLKKWLEREVKAGRVQKLWNTQRYPQGKFMYWIPGTAP